MRKIAINPSIKVDGLCWFVLCVWFRGIPELFLSWAQGLVFILLCAFSGPIYSTVAKRVSLIFHTIVVLVFLQFSSWHSHPSSHTARCLSPLHLILCSWKTASSQVVSPVLVDQPCFSIWLFPTLTPTSVTEAALKSFHPTPHTVFRNYC